MPFNVKEHIITCQRFKQHSNKLSSLLSVKQYSPSENVSPSKGDVTIIAAHGNGFVKELYEPLWEDLEQELKKKGRKIRSIWMADQCNQGASGLINEDSKFDDVSWYDHTRDLSQMINHFQSEMLQPMIAIGHSMGANQMYQKLCSFRGLSVTRTEIRNRTMLAVAHPTLFTALINIEPMFHTEAIVSVGTPFIKGILKRKVEWPSRQEAERTFAAAFKSWDARVLERLNAHSLHPYPNKDQDSRKTEKDDDIVRTRLLTGRYQELIAVLRPSFIYKSDGESGNEGTSYPEEALLIHDLLPFIPCPTLYVCGGTSFISGHVMKEDWLARTGIRALQQPLRDREVAVVAIKDTGHFTPFEDPGSCAKAMSEWVCQEVEVWQREDEVFKRTWDNQPLIEKQKRAEAWMEGLKSKI